jgi:cytochrome c-type biogenesis protein CcmF
MHPGEVATVGGYTLRFDGVRDREGPNYSAARGTLQLLRDGKPVRTLHPEKRVYHAQNQPMTESAIDSGLTRDLYVALGEPLPDGAWSVRLHYKPLVVWIWLGCIVMALGGLLATLDRRYRVTAPQRTAPERRAAASGSRAA